MKQNPSEYKTHLAYIKKLYEEQVPFNKLLGINILKIDVDELCIQLEMKPEFVGNFIKKILHGGVISSLLDLTGGLMAFIGVLKRTQRYLSFEEVTKRFTQTGTIDLRVDYLNPGKGKYFLSEASILRLGNKIAVVRTDLKNDQSVLIASGTGTYLIG
jgi:uncharacterized protein (TIGR00369 family)